MYKNFLIVFVVSIVIIFVPKLSFANSISLSSLSKTVEPGKTFSLSVYVDSSSSQSFTAQANIDFPSDLVSVESFTYGSSWFPISQTGYDIIDNNSGKLIKTAGYPNGFKNEILFGTIVFKTKKIGLVNISTNKSSYILDMDSNNTLTNYGFFSININTPIVVAPVVKIEEPSKQINTTLPKTPEVKNVVKTDTVKTNTEEPIVAVDSLVSNEIIKKGSILNNIILLFNGALAINQFFNLIL